MVCTVNTLALLLFKVIFLFFSIQKLKSRKIAVQKSAAISDKDKALWKECLLEELVSSEDSDEDGSFFVRPLPWRSEKVNNLFTSLDRKLEKKNLGKVRG